MSSLSKELLKIKEIKSEIKSILIDNGIKLTDTDKFSDYPAYIKQICARNSQFDIIDVTNNINNVGNPNRNLYNCKFVNLNIKPQQGYRYIVEYKSLQNNSNGVIFGNKDFKVLPILSNNIDFIKIDKICDIDSTLDIYLFGYNDGTKCTKDEIPMSIRSFLVIDNNEKLILDLVGHIHDGVICFKDKISNTIYMNLGTGENFYDINKESKLINQFPSFSDLIN